MGIKAVLQFFVDSKSAAYHWVVAIWCGRCTSVAVFYGTALSTAIYTTAMNFRCKCAQFHCFVHVLIRMY